MPPPTEASLPTTNDLEFRDETTITGLAVHGTLPAGLSGRLLGIGPNSAADNAAAYSLGGNDGLVHSVDLHAGRARSYRSRWVITDAVAQRFGVDQSPGPRNIGPDVVASNIVVFGGSILALGDGSLAYELTSGLDTIRRVDLAGRSRGLSAYPKVDPVTGDLHVLAVAANGDQAHVVVSSRAFTRTSLPISGAPDRIKDLAITREHLLFVTDGFVGVTSRDGEPRTMWITTGLDAPHPVHAHDAGDTIVIYAVTPSLERWTLHAASATIRRDVLDPLARRFARSSDHPVGGVPRFVWTSGDGAADNYDLATASHVRHVFERGCQPGDFVFVADDARPTDADGGWLVGFVHHTSTGETDLVVLDAADIAGLVVATVRIPQRIRSGLHSTWIPSTTSTTG